MVYVERPSSGSVGSPTSAHTPQYSRPFGRSLRSATPLTDTPATSASVGREGTPASDRILSGRIKKTPRKTVLRKEDVLSEKEKEEERRQLDDMNEERKLFPGSDNWADDELRLFKILFMRQYSPLLPADWQMSFRGIPIPDILFASSIAHPPIINSKSDNDYKATKALNRLIELTKDVRGLAQTGQRHRASALVGKRLNEYIRWAEQDGNYANLDYVPNIIVDVVDTTKTPQEIEEHMQQRLKIAAVAQRAHWRVDQPGNDGDDEIEHGKQSDRDPEEVEPEDNQVVLVPDKYPSPQKEDFPPSTPAQPPAHNGTNGNSTRYHKITDKTPNDMNKSVQHWSEKFDRQPPVVYGLFIVNTSVMVLTIDSAKEEDAYVSYQVEVGFSKRGQDVWNAITIAIVVCMARDGMIEMKDEFEDSIINYDSDPDA